MRIRNDVVKKIVLGETFYYPADSILIPIIFESVEVHVPQPHDRKIRELSRVVDTYRVFLKRNNRNGLSFEKLLDLHIYSEMLRVGIRIQKRIGKTPHLAMYDIPPSYFEANKEDYFLSDGKCFLWKLEPARWDVQLSCEVMVHVEENNEKLQTLQKL